VALVGLYPLSFARLGAHLVINSRQSSAEALAETEHLIRTLGCSGFERHCRCIRRPDVERLVGEALARFGRVDVLVNNASALGPTPMPYLTRLSYR